MNITFLNGPKKITFFLLEKKFNFVNKIYIKGNLICKYVVTKLN